MSVNENEALDNLVTQFSSSLDFYRELVQNSIDAGSTRIDVWLEYEPGDDDEGTIAIHVDDFGEGMDEAIIDGQLTKLFSSSKEDDLTKIGKFGIGFVSIFAIKPKAVLLHTGRGGEFWEILFHEDRSFTKTPVDTPVEGTQITLYLAGNRDRYDELKQNTRATLKKWCRHSDTEVWFEDRDDLDGPGPEQINEPFEVRGECLTKVEHEGTLIVLAYAFGTHYSFYNRGLTLSETSDAEDALGGIAPRFTNINVKIKSRYLEHTLSRETVMRDGQYEKAMKLLLDAANGPLAEQLMGDLEALASARDLGLAEQHRYFRLIRFLVREPDSILEANESRRILRTYAGEAVSLQDVFRQLCSSGTVYLSPRQSQVCVNLSERGVPIIAGAPLPTGSARPEHFLQAGDGQDTMWPVRILIARYMRLRESAWHRVLRRKLGQTLGLRLSRRLGLADPERFLVDPHTVFLPVSVDEEMERTTKRLLERAANLLKRVQGRRPTLATCRLQESVMNPPAFLVGERFSSLMNRPPEVEEERPARVSIAVNREHPFIRQLIDTFEAEPALASYCLAKSLLWNQEDVADVDAQLIELARGMS